MPRGPKKEVTYTGKALKAFEKVQKLENDLKTAKEELKLAYKEQVKSEKAAEAKAKKAASVAAKKEMREKKAELMDAIAESGKSIDEIMEMLKS